MWIDGNGTFNECGEHPFDFCLLHTLAHTNGSMVCILTCHVSRSKSKRQLRLLLFPLLTLSRWRHLPAQVGKHFNVLLLMQCDNTSPTHTHTSTHVCVCVCVCLIYTVLKVNVAHTLCCHIKIIKSVLNCSC